MPYSPEFSNSGTDLRFLNLLAHAGGGSILGANDTATAFSPNLPHVYTGTSIIFWLFALAAILLPIDIALRRLSSLEFLVVGYQWLSTHLGLRKATQAKERTDNLVLDTIRSRREERRSRASGLNSKAPPVVRPATSQVQPDKLATKTLEKQQEESMTEKLLEAKRKRTGAKTQEE